jgi:hypothetical protein
MRRAAWIVCASAAMAVAIQAQQPRSVCPPQGWSLAQLDTLKKDQFVVEDVSARRELALALTACLADSNPALRDGIAFEAFTTWMRGKLLDRPTLAALRSQLIDALSLPDAEGFNRPFSALVLAEVARTDRVEPWMSDAEREAVVRAAASFLERIRDYRAFDDRDGFRHGVAHGADLVLQLTLNPAVTKVQIDHLLPAVASQVSPDAGVAYWAGEPERLARPVLFAAQRKLHTADEWSRFFREIANPKPLESWKAAFSSERGIRKRHNVRAFLLSVYANATSSDDPAIRQLAAPATAALKAVP